MFEIMFDTCLLKFQFPLLSSLHFNKLFLLYNMNSVSASANLPLSCHTFAEWNCSPTKRKCPVHSSAGRGVICRPYSGYFWVICTPPLRWTRGGGGGCGCGDSAVVVVIVLLGADARAGGPVVLAGGGYGGGGGSGSSSGSRLVVSYSHTGRKQPADRAQVRQRIRPARTGHKRSGYIGCHQDITKRPRF